MASINSETQYSRTLVNFRGVDLSSGESRVNLSRFAYLKNMYRDYESEQGDAVETVPGFRLLSVFAGKRINGIYEYQPTGGELQVVVHAGTSLYVFNHADRDEIAADSGKITEYPGVADAKSSAFMFSNKFWLLDGSDYWCLYEGELKKVTDDAYLPVTYINGTAYEQRNLLSDLTVNRDTQMAEYDATEILDVEELNSNDKIIKGFKEGYSCQDVYVPSLPDKGGINAEAFKGNQDIRRVRLSVTGGYATIGANVFEDCTNLEEVYWTGSLRGDSLFRNCTKLKTVYHDWYTNGGGDTPFWGCTELETVYIKTPAGNEEWLPSDYFSTNTKLKTIYLDSVINVGGGYWDGSEYIVEWSAFAGCDAIENVYVSVESGSVPEEFEEYFPENAVITYNTPTPAPEDVLEMAIPGAGKTWRAAVCYDPADRIAKVTVDGEETDNYFAVYRTIDGERYVERIVSMEDWTESEVDITLNCKPSKFASVEEHINFVEGNVEYEGSAKDAICKCTVSAIYDGRVFFTGNPELPNTVFYAQRDLTGYANPTYFGVLNYVNDGVGASRNRAMLATSGMLMVLKGDTIQDGSIFYHTGADTGDNLIPRVYPSTQGVAGLGCAGAACNFLDDPVFLSRRGLEAVGKQQVNLERTIAHRSSMIDRFLIAEDLAGVSLVEWRGYLCIFCPSGHVYLADSRQLFEHQGGVQYEWYFLDDIGIYEGQTQDYSLVTGMVRAYDWEGVPRWLNQETVYVNLGSERRMLNALGVTEGYVASSDVYSSYIYTSEDGAEILYSDEEHTEPILAYVAEYGGDVYLVEPSDRYSGGVFTPAVAAHSVTVDDVLYFGTAGGHLCCFNNDKRGEAFGDEPVESDRIHRNWYTFNGRTIHSCATTSFEDGGFPGIAKKTVKKSMVLHTKTLDNSKFDVLVRTDRTEAWLKVGTVSNSTVQFFDGDFGNTSLHVSNEAVTTVREQEKKWAKKSYMLESKYHKCPFGLFQIGYRFQLKGRLKQ